MLQVKPEENLVVYTKGGDQQPGVVVRNLKNNIETRFDYQVDKGFKCGGNAYLSPNNKFVAFNSAVCDPEKERIRVIVGNLETGDQEIIFESQDFYKVENWVSDEELTLF